MPTLPRLTAREVGRVLERDGWIERHQSSASSHKYYTHPTNPGRITVAQHPGDIPAGTLTSIFKQAG
jgi:predicted RNA binding protein YcfA (HicA-like mRNA interferase family)